MTILIVGASGATGKQLTEQLLNQGEHVKIVVRNLNNLPENITQHEHVSIVQASILDLSDNEIAELVKDCQAIASCLGHNLNFQGIFGQPRLLVTDTVTRICQAIKSNQPKSAVKFVLMNSNGVRNKDLNEKISFAQHCVLFLLRLLIPPHVDNEKAADYLRTQIAKDDCKIEWVIIRPDNLINNDQVTEYESYPSPVQSAIFGNGSCSRINTAHFMASLIYDSKRWSTWRYQMPVLYNFSKKPT